MCLWIINEFLNYYLQIFLNIISLAVDKRTKYNLYICTESQFLSPFKPYLRSNWPLGLVEWTFYRYNLRLNRFATLQSLGPARSVQHLLNCGRKGKLLHQRVCPRHSQMIYFTATSSFFDEFFSYFAKKLADNSVRSESIPCSRFNKDSGKTWGACANCRHILSTRHRGKQKCGPETKRPR